MRDIAATAASIAVERLAPRLQMRSREEAVMNNSPASLIAPTVLIVLISLVVAVLLVAGVPMAGAGGAVAAALGASVLTAGLAFAFVHESKTGH